MPVLHTMYKLKQQSGLSHYGVKVDNCQWELFKDDDNKTIRWRRREFDEIQLKRWKSRKYCGQTTYSVRQIDAVANRIIGKYKSYNNYTRNCREFAVDLMDTIRYGFEPAVEGYGNR